MSCEMYVTFGHVCICTFCSVQAHQVLCFSSIYFGRSDLICLGAWTRTGRLATLLFYSTLIRERRRGGMGTHGVYVWRVNWRHDTLFGGFQTVPMGLSMPRHFCYPNQTHTIPTRRNGY
jgi:hypothetical protein